MRMQNMHKRKPLARTLFSLALLIAVAALVGCSASRHADHAAATTAPSTSASSSASASASPSAAGTASAPRSTVIVRRLPSHVVAKIGRAAIPAGALQMLLAESKRAARREHVPFAAGSAAYRRAQEQALHQLVVNAALEQAAARLGVVVTQAALTKQFRKVELDYANIDPEEKKASQAEIDEKFDKRLKTLGTTKASLLDSLRLQLLMQGLYAKVTAHVHPATDQAKAAAMQRWTREFNARVARQVVYQRGYAPPHS